MLRSGQALKNRSGPPSREPVALGRDSRRKRGERKGAIRQGAEPDYPITAVSNPPYGTRLDPKACHRSFSYTFLEVRRKTREGSKLAPPRKTEKGLMPRADRKARRCSLAELVVLTRPSFSTARRKRLCNLSHIRQTLNPGVPVLPYVRASCDALGQWLVCRADASPTEDPDAASLKTLPIQRPIGKVKQGLEACQEKSTYLIKNLLFLYIFLMIVVSEVEPDMESDHAWRAVAA